MNPVNVINPLSMLLVALGGAGGCMLRFLAVRLVMRLNPSVFPLGTMFVNILGSLLIGYVLAKFGSDHSARAFIATGLLGGFTTFSAFSWDAMQMLERGAFGSAAIYIGGSVILSLIAVALGIELGR